MQMVTEKENQHQRARRILMHRRLHHRDDIGIVEQPAVHFTQPPKTPYIARRQREQYENVDQRFKRDRRNQAFVALMCGAVFGAEQDGEYGNDDAEHQREICRRGVPLGKSCAAVAENMHGIGDRANLQRQQRHHRQQQKYRDGGADPLAAKAEGQQIGERGELILATDAQQRHQQQRRKQQRAADTGVHREIAVAVAVGRIDSVVDQLEVPPNTASEKT